MILGFAHLAFNTADLDAAEQHWTAEGYTRNALHTDVPNHAGKHVYGAPDPLHDLMLLQAAGCWPLELTRHGATQGRNEQLLWGREAITLQVPQPEALATLLEQGLKMRPQGDGTYQLASPLPGWSCTLRLEQAATEPVSLTREGGTCLAFYSNRVEQDRDRLLQLGATDATESFQLTLGDRSMSIALMRAPGGPLLELINPRTRTS